MEVIDPGDLLTSSLSIWFKFRISTIISGLKPMTYQLQNTVLEGKFSNSMLS